MPRAFVTDESGKKIIIADSDDVIYIEGNVYFPPDSVKQEFFKVSDRHTTCFWKGEASYKTVKVGNIELQDATWFYPEPKKESIERVGKDFSNYHAFWHGVEVET